MLQNTDENNVIPNNNNKITYFCNIFDVLYFMYKLQTDIIQYLLNIYYNIVITDFCFPLFKKDCYFYG